MRCTACGCETVGGHFCKACGLRMEGTASGSGWRQQAWMPLGAGAASHRGVKAAAPPRAGFAPQGGSPNPYFSSSQPRVQQNLQGLGTAWCAFGVYRLVKGMIAGFVLQVATHRFGWFGEESNFLPDFLSALVPVIAVTTFVMAALSLLAGYGLLTRRSWGRRLAIVMGVLSLIKIPFGTALGIYTLWVLGSRASGLEYEAMAAG